MACFRVSSAALLRSVATFSVGQQYRNLQPQPGGKHLALASRGDPQHRRFSKPRGERGMLTYHEGASAGSNQKQSEAIRSNV